MTKSQKAKISKKMKAIWRAKKVAGFGEAQVKKEGSNNDLTEASFEKACEEIRERYLHEVEPDRHRIVILDSWRGKTKVSKWYALDRVAALDGLRAFATHIDTLPTGIFSTKYEEHTVVGAFE